jgi:hypothetical protein
MKGYLMNFGAVNNESNIFGFACSPERIFKCRSDKDCKSEQRWSSLYGLLDNGN